MAMMSKRAILPMLALILPISACNEEPERRADDGRAADGEVLPGTTTDAMIPLDQLQSQGDLAQPAEEAEDASGASSEPAEDAEDETG